MATNWPSMNRRGPVVADADVQRFEQGIGATLPDDYRRFLLEINGGRTAPNHRTFLMRRKQNKDETTLNTLHSLDDPDESHDLAAHQRFRREEYPSHGLRIGYDDGGSAIVLILAGPHRGEVWMLDQVDPRPDGSNPRVDWFDRRDVVKLADTFRAFMDGLAPLNAAVSAKG